MTLEGYIDTKSAAVELGVTETRIRQMLIDGQFEGAIKFPENTNRGVWLIPHTEIARLKQLRAEQRDQRRIGRPPKSKDT
jgi:hypothetical protein